MRLTYLQIEITGNCSHRCRICLPAEKRTRIDMTTTDAEYICRQAESAGVYALTVTGFGNPVEHPRYLELMKLFAGKFKTTVTCRPQDLLKIGPAHRVNVSVCSSGDAEQLVSDALERAPAKLVIVPHIVLTKRLREDLGSILLRRLFQAMARWEKISIASPVVLCNDPRHLAAIREANENTSRTWGVLRRMVHALPPDQAGKVVMQDYRPRAKNCAWINGGLLVNGRLDVLPCCNLPCVVPVGNLKVNTLEEIALHDPHARYRGYCEKCPNIGG